MKNNSSKPFIVYTVVHIADVSGGTRVIVEHANRLHARGYRVEIWTSDAGARPYFPCDVPVKTIEPKSLNDPDIVVLTDPYLLPMATTHRPARRTFLLMQHDNDWVLEVMGVQMPKGIVNEYRDYFVSGPYSILAVSAWLCDVAKERYGIDATLFPNGIDPDLFYPAEPLVQSDDPSILLVYDPQVWKGFADAVQAVLAVKKTITNLRIMIMGRYFPETPKDTGLYYGFPFPVLFFNAPDQHDLAKIYASATIFISASWREGFGLPGLEALACGTPLLTTDSGGVREYAVPDETAVVVPANNPDAMAEATVRLLRDSDLRQTLSKNGLQKVRGFSWGSNIHRLEEIFGKDIL